jgi:hypothetical protein
MKNRNDGMLERWNDGENVKYERQAAESIALHFFHYPIIPIFHYSDDLGVLRSGC